MNWLFGYYNKKPITEEIKIAKPVICCSLYKCSNCKSHKTVYIEDQSCTTEFIRCTDCGHSWEQSIPLNKTQIIPSPTFEKSSSVITIDLLNFDTRFSCPLCKTMLNIVTLSDHMGEHKYAELVDKKNKNKETNVDADFEKAIHESLNIDCEKTRHTPHQPVIISVNTQKSTHSTDEIDLHMLNPD